MMESNADGDAVVRMSHKRVREDNEVGEIRFVGGTKYSGSGWAWIILGALSILLLLAVGGSVGVTSPSLPPRATSFTPPPTEQKEGREAPPRILSPPPCEAAMHGRVQQFKQPRLELVFTPIKKNFRLINTTEQSLMNSEIIAAFNRVTGLGCKDTEYGRWMVNVTFVNQQVFQQPDVLYNSDPIEPDIVPHYSLLVGVALGIWCSGCQEKTAFATTYPDTFEIYGGSGGTGNQAGLNRRVLHHKHPDSVSNMGHPPDGYKFPLRGVGVDHREHNHPLQGDWILSGGHVMTEISKAISELMLAGLGPMTEATIKTRSPGTKDGYQTERMTEKGKGNSNSMGVSSRFKERTFLLEE
jgi:hypothetical protein